MLVHILYDGHYGREFIDQSLKSTSSEKHLVANCFVGRTVENSSTDTEAFKALLCNKMVTRVRVKAALSSTSPAPCKVKLRLKLSENLLGHALIFLYEKTSNRSWFSTHCIYHFL